MSFTKLTGIATIGALSAVFAAVTGYLLSQSGEYGSGSVFWHQWIGIGTAVLATSTYLLRRGKYFFFVFTLTQVAVIVAGHLGGQLTHGSDYLTENLPTFLKSEIQQVAISMNEAEVFPHVILPILEKNCQSCHNESKMKGELIMTSYASLLKGGENGNIVEMNNPQASDMIKRIHLAKDHEDAMPPEGKKRLSREEIELLEFWVDSGLKNEMKVTEMSLDDRMIGIISDRLDTDKASLNPVFDKRVSRATTADIEALTAVGFTITPLAKGSPFLQASYFNRLDTLTKAETDLLGKIGDQTVWLDLSGIYIEDWSFLSALNNLVRLHLKTTTIGDDELNTLNGQNLEHLNLFETGITNEALNRLEEFKRLKTLYIGKTSIVADDIISWLKGNPGLKIDLGRRSDTLRIKPKASEQ